MFKIASGYWDFCVPYNPKEDVLIDILKEMIDGEFCIE